MDTEIALTLFEGQVTMLLDALLESGFDPTDFLKEAKAELEERQIHFTIRSGSKPDLLDPRSLN